MAKFQFRLEPLKKFRENRLLAARREMLGVQNEILATSEERRRAFAERARILESDDPMDRIRGSALVEGATRIIEQLNARQRGLEEDFERHRRWVAHLGAELKAIEKLEERQRAQFEEAQKLREKRASDRWVAESWSRGRAGSEGAA